MSHAPGTWDVRKGTLSIYTNYGGSTYHKVADARQPLFTRECQEANARLIAAAPDLLQALKWLACEADEDMPSEYRTNSFRTALDNAFEAIAKAKGT